MNQARHAGITGNGSNEGGGVEGLSAGIAGGGSHSHGMGAVIA